mmetsp:Transcript_25245/g.69717  ORF Transcript_25245/g.69717 Transcript_25245/m.69717 type:complete len:395 (-) Transcript_25245:144-1328(-)
MSMNDGTIQQGLIQDQRDAFLIVQTQIGQGHAQGSDTARFDVQLGIQNGRVGHAQIGLALESQLIAEFLGIDVRVGMDRNEKVPVFLVAQKQVFGVRMGRIRHGHVADQFFGRYAQRVAVHFVFNGMFLQLFQNGIVLVFKSAAAGCCSRRSRSRSFGGRRRLDGRQGGVSGRHDRTAGRTLLYRLAPILPNIALVQAKHAPSGNAGVGQHFIELLQRGLQPRKDAGRHLFHAQHDEGGHGNLGDARIAQLQGFSRQVGRVRRGQLLFQALDKVQDGAFKDGFSFALRQNGHESQIGRFQPRFLLGRNVQHAIAGGQQSYGPHPTAGGRRGGGIVPTARGGARQLHHGIARFVLDMGTVVAQQGDGLNQEIFDARVRGNGARPSGVGNGARHGG